MNEIKIHSTVNLTSVTPLSQILDNYDIIMFDIWGVLMEDVNELYNGISIVINNLCASKKNILFVSNSPRTKDAISGAMCQVGLDVHPWQFFTSGQMTHDFLHNKTNIYIVSESNHFTTNQSFTCTSDIYKANALLFTSHIDDASCINKFNDLFKVAIERDLKMICPNPDTIIPYAGKERYCPGYFANIYENMGGNVIYIGKPGVSIFNQAIDSINPKQNRARVLMIGDTIEMDIRGARDAQIHSGLVMTGNTARITQSLDSLQEKLSYINNRCNLLQIKPSMIIDILH